jgi:hypothetical protein
MNKDSLLPSGFANTVRIAPNEFIRSALFGLVQKSKDRLALQSVEIASLSNIKITYTGFALSQYDLDVFLSILYLARDNILGTIVSFNASDILRALNLVTKGDNVAFVDASVERIMSAVITVKQGSKRKYRGHLIEKSLSQNKENDCAYVITLNRDLINLFDYDNYTLLSANIRSQLNGQLSKWLYAFYESHRQPHPMFVDTIRTLCGSTTKDLWRFRQQLRLALTELEAVMTANNKPFSWVIDASDKVVLTV